jgi:selenoprotein W-related protein
MEDQVTIEYCVPCHFEKQAVQLAKEIEDQFSGRISQVILEPIQSIGSFEVSLGKELIFSKMISGHLPHPGEIVQLIMMRLFK